MLLMLNILKYYNKRIYKLFFIYMIMEVCLQHISGNKYLMIDCETGQPISFKSKRKPSAYNLFLKECLKRHSGSIQERFKVCAEEWKRRK